MTKKRKPFSQEIREAIASAEITQYRLFKETGIAQPTLSRFMKGKGGLSTEGLDRIAATLGLHVVVEQPKKKGD